MTEPDAESQSVAGVFDLTRRGYDRRQVDDHVTNLLVQLSEAERARRREEGRANRAESELAEVRERLRSQAGRPDAERPGDEGSWGEAGSAHHGFGLRVEKLLRAAEQEAAETRDTATQEATTLLEQARSEAEAHRAEVETSLNARQNEIDKKIARNQVELDDRERQVTEQSVAAREKADRLLAEARERATQIEAEARAQAAQQLAETERAAEGRRAEADEELARLRGLRRGVRGDLARMLALLAEELERPEARRDGAGSTADTDSGWFEQTEVAGAPAARSPEVRTNGASGATTPVSPATGR